MGAKDVLSRKEGVIVGDDVLGEKPQLFDTAPTFLILILRSSVQVRTGEELRNPRYRKYEAGLITAISDRVFRMSHLPQP